MKSILNLTAAVALFITATCTAASGCDRPDITSGILHMPAVMVGTGTYELEMTLQGGQSFGVTSVNPAGFAFATAYLTGKTLYNVYPDIDTGAWTLVVFTFTDTAWSAYEINTPQTLLGDNVAYTVTPEGFIKYIDPDGGGEEYIRAVLETPDYLELAWGDLTSVNGSQPAESEYFFFDLQQAQAFLDKQNGSATGP